MPVVLFLLVVWNPGETSTPGIPGQNKGLRSLKRGGTMGMKIATWEGGSGDYHLGKWISSFSLVYPDNLKPCVDRLLKEDQEKHPSLIRSLGFGEGKIQFRSGEVFLAGGFLREGELVQALIEKGVIETHGDASVVLHGISHSQTHGMSLAAKEYLKELLRRAHALLVEDSQSQGDRDLEFVPLR